MPANWCATCRPRQAPANPVTKARSSSSSIPKEYTGADLAHLYRVEPATSCWIWIGEFRTYGAGGREVPIIRVAGGRHRFCGTAHNAMSRTFFEERLGRTLTKNENVRGTCSSNEGNRHACVNPEHHEIRRGAGEMFGRDMQ